MWLDVLIITIAVVLAALVLGAAYVAAKELPSLVTVRRHRVMLVLDDETTVSGVLWARRGPLYVMRNSMVAQGASDQLVAADGEIIVDRARVVWMQKDNT